jgi:hypothetical protein
VILPIVEGHGEVTAVPILIRRIVAHYAPDVYTHAGQVFVDSGLQSWEVIRKCLEYARYIGTISLQQLARARRLQFSDGVWVQVVEAHSRERVVDWAECGCPRHIDEVQPILEGCRFDRQGGLSNPAFR